MLTVVRALGARVERGMRRRQGDEQGFMLVFFTIMLVMLLGVAGLAVDFSNWSYQGQREQKAADAAALAGAVFLPDNPTTAVSKALEIATANGYSADSKTTVDAHQDPNNEDRMVVTITRTVDTIFAGAVGFKTKTITRTAVAEYDKPIAMGSPSSQFGNDPEASTMSGDQYPGFWASVAGGNTDKVQGDGYAAKVCNREGNSDNCSGGTNTDYDPTGYTWTIHANAGTSFYLEAYDPAYVATGETCDGSYATDRHLDDASRLNVVSANNPIPGYPTPTGVRPSTRYKVNSNDGSDLDYCTGDQGFEMNSGGHTPDPFPTTFTVTGPASIPGNPQSVPDTPICQMTFPGYDGNIATRLTSNTDYLSSTCISGGSRKFGSVFHAWYPVAVIPGDGDWFVNVSTPSNDGNGENKFALRACSTASVTTCTQMTGVQLYATARMSLYANIGGSGTQTSFYLARLTPGAAGRTLVINLYDLGDANTGSSGTFWISSTNLTSSQLNCQYTPPPGPSKVPPYSGFTNTQAGCKIGGVGSNYNGQWIQIKVPIPSTGYTCNVNVATDCWFKINFNFTGGVHDTTTWTANLSGDPVRIVQ